VDHRGPRGSFCDVRTIEVALPRLDPDSAATCPVAYERVLEHVTTEFDDRIGKRLSEPAFLRTARIGATSYWIWRFNDPSRGDGYIVVSLWPPNIAATECDDTFGMTPEQFIVATHFNIEP
jgi:hypothetical protein